jgi:DNA-binding NtrC family response regulator
VSISPSILIVDDDAPLREFLRTALSVRAFAVDSVGDGEEALLMLQQTCYDAVVLDLLIHGIKRHDVLGALIEQLPQARRVVLTSCEPPLMLHDAHALVVRTTLRKPFDLDQLLFEVEACVNATAFERPLAASFF